eukprot:2552776-Alexandrium_andersonii.AAC.1
MPAQAGTILGLEDLLRAEPASAKRPSKDPPGRQAARNVQLARARRSLRQREGADWLVPAETSQGRSPS